MSGRKGGEGDEREEEGWVRTSNKKSSDQVYATKHNIDLV
jgi:hypothetical protein